MSSPVTSPAKIERLETNSDSEPNTDDTIAILGDVGTVEDSNDEHKTLQFEKVNKVRFIRIFPNNSENLKSLRQWRWNKL